jgi:hypothetical protein
MVRHAGLWLVSPYGSWPFLVYLMDACHLVDRLLLLRGLKEAPLFGIELEPGVGRQTPLRFDEMQVSALQPTPVEHGNDKRLKRSMHLLLEQAIQLTVHKTRYCLA